MFGIDFFSVLSRGSQYKVEAFMFRIAKPENFVLLSPSREEARLVNLSFEAELTICPVGWSTKCGGMYSFDNVRPVPFPFLHS